MPDIISICFIQPATVDLATALCGIIKVIIEKLHFFPPRLIQQSKATTTHNALSDGNASTHNALSDGNA